MADTKKVVMDQHGEEDRQKFQAKNVLAKVCM